MIKVLGGPDEYKWRDMKTAHEKLHISIKDFDITAKYL